MNSGRSLRFLAFLTLLLAGASQSSFGQTTVPSKLLHLSLTEARFDHDRGRLLLTVRLQTEDLENALSRRAGKKTSASDPAELAPLALDYIRENLIIRPARADNLRLEWAGQDLTSTQIFLFFEAPLKSSLLGATIRDTLLFDELSDQVNSVEVHEGVSQQTLVFSKGKPEKVVDSNLASAPEARR